jgi:hypothetical protein
VHTGFWWEKKRESVHLEGPGVGGKIIVRWIVRKRDVLSMDRIELAYDRDR